MPIADGIAGVVVSNCVLNLVPDKEKAFAETQRILKSAGHFSISDVVIAGDLPISIRESAEMYAGCVAAAMEKNEYLKMVKNAGVGNRTAQKMKEIQLPDEMLLNYASQREA